MLKKMLFGIGLIGLSIASAKTYSVTLGDPYTVGSTELKAGDYKLVVNNGNAVLEDSRGKVQANGTLQQETEKFDNTAVLSNRVNDTPHLQAIEIGGTHLRVDFK